MESSLGFENKLEGLREQSKDLWVAKCPAHEDGSPSFYIRKSEDRWLLHCHAGCGLEEICLSLGIRQSDLWFDGSKRPSKPKENIDWELEETIVWLGENSIERPTDRDWERFTRAKLLLARRGIHQSASSNQKALGLQKP